MPNVSTSPAAMSTADRLFTASSFVSVKPRYEGGVQVVCNEGLRAHQFRDRPHHPTDRSARRDPGVIIGAQVVAVVALLVARSRLRGSDSMVAEKCSDEVGSGSGWPLPDSGHGVSGSLPLCPKNPAWKIASPPDANSANDEPFSRMSSIRRAAGR